MTGGVISLGGLVLLWALLAITTIAIRIYRGERECGLVWAYVAALWLIHWPAAVIYLVPFYPSINEQTVYLGFAQATVGILGFMIGAALLAPTLATALKPPHALTVAHPPHPMLPRSYIIIGLLMFGVIVPLAGRLPTLGALATAGTQLLLVGICLRCWHGWHIRDRWMFYSALAVAAVIPFGTVVGQGFLAFGASAVMTVLCFCGSYIRPRWKVAVAGVFVAYFGFSAYVTYMRDRTELRRVVWGGESLMNRMQTVVGTAGAAELFDPTDVDHLYRIDMRLNQNFLVGSSVEMLSSGARDYAKGATIREAFASVIPRALWPDKPIYAGSPQVVSNFTGMVFAQGTSVGVGQVMEFYINFGTLGVLIGFILLGCAIGVFDAWATERLWLGDWQHFSMWFVAGIGFIQAGGSLIEVISSVAAGLLTAIMVNRYLLPYIVGAQMPLHVEPNPSRS